MIGAIAGDIIGSRFERDGIKTTDFQMLDDECRFTDDTVLTCAVAHAILNRLDFGDTIKHFALKYPDAGYGGTFTRWIWAARSHPYNSWGNGSAMRVSPVGFSGDTVDAVLDAASATAIVTHNHPEGIKGARATALSVFMARTGAPKSKIREEITRRFGYDLNRSLEEIRPHYQFDISCQGSVPESIIAFLESDDFESTVRNAISLGGDTDTMACIAGGIAQAYYGQIPGDIIAFVKKQLPADLLDTVTAFDEKFSCLY